MPPRWAVFAIVVSWLVAISWLIHRDMWPQWFPPPDEPPRYEVNMTDEFGSNHTDWQVFLDGEDAGMGSSEVRDLGDGTLEFSTVIRFQKKPLFKFCTYLGSTNRITNKGELKELHLRVKVLFEQLKIDQAVEIGLSAKIEDGHLQSKLSFMGEAKELDPIEVPENGIVFNPAHLGTRIRQLRKGQTWRVPMVDVGAILKKAQGIFDTDLCAEVSDEIIQWSGQDVLCFRIDFSQRGKGVIASTWVRRRDGQVLKQQASMFGAAELLLIRSNSVSGN